MIRALIFPDFLLHPYFCYELPAWHIAGLPGRGNFSFTADQDAVHQSASFSATVFSGYEKSSFHPLKPASSWLFNKTASVYVKYLIVYTGRKTNDI